MKKFTLPFIITILLITACSKEQNAEKSTEINQTKQQDAPAIPKKGTTNETAEGDVQNQIIFLEKVYEENGKWFAKVDYIQFLTGDKGLEEAKKRGVAEKETDENGKVNYYLLNDYAIFNDNTKIRTFEIEPSADIYTYDFNSDKVIDSNTTPKTDISTLQKTREDDYPYLINVEKGKITRIKQIFIP